MPVSLPSNGRMTLDKNKNVAQKNMRSLCVPQRCHELILQQEVCSRLTFAFFFGYKNKECLTKEQREASKAVNKPLPSLKPPRISTTIYLKSLR